MAYVVAITLEDRALDAPTAIVVGVGLGLGLGMVNGFIVTVLRVPAIVATLGTLSIFRGIDYLIAGSHQVPVAEPPAGLHRRRLRLHPGHPDLRAHHGRDRRRRDHRAAVPAVRAAAVRRGEQPGGGGDPRHPVATGRLHRLCPVRAARRGRRRDVGRPVRHDQRHRGDRLRPGRRRRRRGRWRQHLRWLGHAGRCGAGRLLPGVRRERPDPRGPVAVLAAGHLRRGDPRCDQRGRARPRAPAADPAVRRPHDDRDAGRAALRPPRRGSSGARPLGDAAVRRRSSR